MAGPSWHYVFKFIITGDAAVGKSSLLVRLTDQRFLANPDPTLGVEFGSELITLEDVGKTVKLQCWDTAGTESFRAITRSYYRGAAGCLLVYDVTSKKSFENARTWLSDVRMHADPELTCILVGNKVDLCLEEEEDPSSSSSPPTTTTGTSPPSHPQQQLSPPATKPTPLRRRQVPHALAAQFARDENLLFVEASAKSGQGVEEAFVTAARDILNKVEGGAFNDSTGVKLSNPTTSTNDVALDAGRSGGKGACC